MLTRLPSRVRAVAYGINAAGQVVGMDDNGNWTHATLWDGQERTDLGTLGGRSATAQAINNAGQVVGEAQTASGDRRAFLWEDGVMTDLGTLPDTHTAWPSNLWSQANAINASGQIVGYSHDALGMRAFLWEDGVMTHLEGLHVAHAINDAGQIVGAGPYTAFLWERGVATDWRCSGCPTWAGAYRRSRRT